MLKGTVTLNPGVFKLTGGSIFNGTGKRHVKLYIASRTTGIVTVTADGATTDISYQGITMEWNASKQSDLKLGSLLISAAGDAVVLINYSI